MKRIFYALTVLLLSLAFASCNGKVGTEVSSEKEWKDGFDYILDPSKNDTAAVSDKGIAAKAEGTVDLTATKGIKAVTKAKAKVVVAAGSPLQALISQLGGNLGNFGSSYGSEADINLIFTPEWSVQYTPDYKAADVTGSGDNQFIMTPGIMVEYTGTGDTKYYAFKDSTDKEWTDWSADETTRRSMYDEWMFMFNALKESYGKAELGGNGEYKVTLYARLQVTGEQQGISFIEASQKTDNDIPVAIRVRFDDEKRVKLIAIDSMSFGLAGIIEEIMGGQVAGGGDEPMVGYAQYLKDVSMQVSFNMSVEYPKTADDLKFGVKVPALPIAN